MYLSKLELHGFKSFAERTTLQFDPGITAVVGPNGCGKSNVVDAVRWVVGEQRARVLRSEKMDNVIFNGAARRRPLGMAEVLLTIENTRGVLPTEYGEVTIGRRLYRSGESEYLLNGVQCRLKDIVDLFMDTGMGAGAYSVIELKMVDEILSENAHDRRHLFEEAAGITKYKLRRAQTLRKLDGTQADLDRLRDLTDEIGKRVRSLKRQAEKAARFKEHAARLRSLELLLTVQEHTRLGSRQATTEGELAALRAETDALGAALLAEDERLTALQQELGRREQALAEAQRAAGRHAAQLHDAEAEQRLEAERRAATLRDRERTEREQAEDARRREHLAAEAARLAADEAEAVPNEASARRALDAAQADRDRTHAALEAARATLEAARRDAQQADHDRADAQRRLDRLANRLDLLAQDEARLAQQQDDDQAAMAALAQRRDAAARHLAEATRDARDAEAARDAAEAARDAAQLTLEAARDALRSAERRRDAAQAEVQLLESLLASYEEVGEAVQFLAEASGWHTGELLTVADVLACDEADRLALDAALGAYAACVVVAGAEQARQAAALLRAEQRGQATFLLLDRLQLPPSPPDEAALPLLRPRVRPAAPRYAPLADVLLHGTYVADRLDALELSALPPEATRVVARTGEWLERRGLVHAGSLPAAPSGAARRLGRREQLQTARAALAQADAEVARSREAVVAARAHLEAVPVAATRHADADARRALAAAEAEAAHAEALVQAALRRRDERAARQRACADEQQRLQAERQAAHHALADADARAEAAHAARRAADEAFQAADADARRALDAHGAARLAALDAHNHLDTLRRELARTRQAHADLEARRRRHAEHLDHLAQALTTADARLAGLQERLATLSAERDDLERTAAAARTALQQTKQDLVALDGRLRRARLQREQLLREENLRAVRLAEITTRRDETTRHLQEDFDTPPDALPPLPDDFDEAAARAEVQALRPLVRGAGNINALALEEYEQEHQRFDFLTRQQLDLEHAEQTLLQTIDEINTTAEARFRETFEAIRGHFGRLFQELFGEEAAADLLLANPADLLESPIEIQARPRGKRPTTIAQLSGGEKTLTAIALLFAIYLVKPSPFCILDEVDAPLDDANVERFMRLIRSFANDIQFILITHNKRTMEAADRLYGVTMEEQGVSRLVGVRFEEVAAEEE